jgi:hypothetical protein
MNDDILTKLKVLVERAVRPVRATISRKQQMREEMLAHLTAIFQEETGKQQDEQIAFDRVVERFGDPGELTTKLQQSVPRWDRSLSILDNMGYRPSESAWHLAVKHFLVMLLVYALVVATWDMLPRLLAPIDRGPMDRKLAFILVGAVLVIALFNVILSLILAPLLNKIGPALASTRRGRILLAALCGFVMLCGFVLPPFAGAAVLFILMARQAVNEVRNEQKWARLEMSG